MARPAGAEPLGRERIVAAALDIVDTRGLEALTLRSLAQALGVYPTAIYWHLKNRDALLAELCSVVLAEALPPREGRPWRDWLRELFVRYRGAVRRHPALAGLVGAQMVSNAGRQLDLVEAVLQALADAGCPPGRRPALYNVVVAAMSGYATLEFAPAPAEAPEAWRDEVQARLAAVDPARQPLLAAALPVMANRAFVLRWDGGERQPLDEGFEAWVEVVLGGLEATIARR